MSNYSQKLIEMVEELYPDNDQIIELAKTGSSSLGRYIDETRSYFPHEVVFKYLQEEEFNQENLDKLIERATKEHDKRELYAKWIKECEDYKAQHGDFTGFAYSEELITEVERVYPDDREIKGNAYLNKSFLGRLLDENSTSKFDSIYKICSDETKSKEDVYTFIMESAQKAKKGQELYDLWSKESYSREI